MALSGKSGTVVGPDYRGVTVLAAYEPVALLDLGLVAKIDMAEIRAPFIRAGIAVFGVTVLLVFAGAWLFLRITRPMIYQLKERARRLEASAESLAASESRMRKIIENNADAILVVGRDGVIRFANPAAETLFGRPAQGLVGIDIGFPVIGQGSADVKILRPSGAQADAAIRSAEMEWEGELCFLASLSDVTERKKAEERIRHLNRVIRAIRNVNQLITKEKDRGRLIRGACENLVATKGFNSAWIALVDESKRSIQCAEAGLGESFLPLKDLLERGSLPPCAQKSLDQTGTSVIEDFFAQCGDCPVRSFYQGQVAFSVRLEHDGRIYGVLASSVPQAFARDREEQGLFQEVGEDIAFALFNIDREEKLRAAEDEKKRIEEQLHQAQKMEAVGRLSGGIAHDFNNLMTIVMGNADLTLMRIPKDAPIREGVLEIKKAAERAASLTRQILVFSRRQIVQPVVLSLNELVLGTDKMLRRIIGEDIELEAALGPDLDRVEADPGQVEQVIMNLAVNARDAMPGGGRLTIETANVELDREYARNHIGVTPGPYVMLAVSDTGMGMTEEVRSHIFDPFFTTKETEKGTGLGLSTVYGIVKQAKGHIWVYTEPGKGACFKIYLPRVEKAGHVLKQPETRPESLQGTETVLVVEDNDQLRDMALKMLKRYGYTVLVAEGGQEALRIAGAHQGTIHLMVTDVVMPNMSGKEVADRIKAMKPGIKILFMSGYTDNAIVHHGILDKGIAFLHKLFTSQGLAQKVREVLGD
jgi:two-component system cell cycle sensor histidine kinase/response regulator CckA